MELFPIVFLLAGFYFVATGKTSLGVVLIVLVIMSAALLEGDDDDDDDEKD